MADPFIAEIRIFAGNFAPRGWAFCDGQLLPISQNTALFSLVGTTYGGDGRTTLGLPDLKGRAPMHPGRGPGLTPRQLGEKSGRESVTLTEAQMPAHSHGLTASEEFAVDDDPHGHYPAKARGVGVYASSGDRVNMHTDTVNTVHSGTVDPHNNMQPYLALTFIIALTGLFPSR